MLISYSSWSYLPSFLPSICQSFLWATSPPFPLACVSTELFETRHSSKMLLRALGDFSWKTRPLGSLREILQLLICSTLTWGERRCWALLFLFYLEVLHPSPKSHPHCLYPVAGAYKGLRKKSWASWAPSQLGQVPWECIRLKMLVPQT